MRFFIVALALMAMFSTASAGVCDKLKKWDWRDKERYGIFEVCKETNDECTFTFNTSPMYNTNSGRAACENVGLKCKGMYRAKKKEECDDYADQPLLGCDPHEWPGKPNRDNRPTRPNVAVCINEPADDEMPYRGPPMPQGEIRPAPYYFGEKYEDCLTGIGSDWQNMGDGIQARTLHSNILGKRIVQLKYSTGDAIPTSTEEKNDSYDAVGSKNIYFKNIVTDDGRWGVMWLDYVNHVIHIDYFKPCNLDYHESYTYEDKKFFDSKYRLSFPSADIDTETNEIYMVLWKRQKDKKAVVGGKIYVLTDKLKEIRSRDLDIRDRDGGMDMNEEFDDPGPFKFWKGKLFMEFIRQKNSGHQGAAAYIYDAKTLDTDGEKKDPNELHTCDHCFGNTPMFISYDNQLIYTDLSDHNYRGVQLVRIGKKFSIKKNRIGDSWKIDQRNVYTSPGSENRIQNKVYTRTGNMIETPEGYLVTFHGQATKLDVKYTDDISKDVSYNVATVLVNKGVFDHSDYAIWCPDSVIKSTDWSDYTYIDKTGVINQGSSSPQRVTGTNWITHETEGWERNAAHPRILSNGKEFFLIYEMWRQEMRKGIPKEKNWRRHYYIESYLQEIDSSGRVIGDRVSLGDQIRPGQKSTFVTIDDIYININGLNDREGEKDDGYTYSNGALLMNLIIPASGKSSGKPRYKPKPAYDPVDVPVTPSGNSNRGSSGGSSGGDLCESSGISSWKGTRDICKNTATHCEVYVKIDASTDTGDSFCKNFGLSCIGAWGDKSNTCTHKNDLGCFDNDGGTSDHVIACGPGSGGSAPARERKPERRPEPKPERKPEPRSEPDTSGGSTDCDAVYGSKPACGPRNPCGEGEGDCRKDRACQTGLVCRNCKCAAARLRSAKPEAQAQMSTMEAMEWGGAYAVMAMTIGMILGIVCMFAVNRSCEKRVNPELQASWVKMDKQAEQI